MASKPKSARVRVRDVDSSDDEAANAAGDGADADADGADGEAAPAQSTASQLLEAMSRQRYRLPPLPSGKRITLSRPGVLAQFRLVKMLGQAAQNQAYVQMVMPLLYVAEIDDADGQGPQSLVFPNSERELEALIARLDEEGVAQVGMAVLKYYSGIVPDPKAEGGARQMTPDEMMEAQRDAIKK